MEVTYKRDAMHNYLVLSQDTTTHSAFQEKMILKNQVKGLLICSLRNFNGENQYYYDISGKQTLDCIFEKRQFGADDLRKLFQGINMVLSHMEKYLLEADYLLLKPEYIYYDLSLKQYSFCFFPYEQSHFHDKLENLAEYLLSHINHQENEAVVVGYQFYRQVKERNCSFKNILEELMIDITYETSGEIQAKKSNEKISETYEQEMLLQSSEENKWDMEDDDDWMESDSHLDPKQCQNILAGFGVFLMLCGFSYGGYSLWLWYHAKMAIRFIATKEFLIAGSLLLLGFIILLFSHLFYKREKDSKMKHETSSKIGEKETVNYEVSDMEDGTEKEAVYEDTSYEEYSKTVLLSENMYKEERILVSQDKRKSFEIPLNNFPFIIGSSKEFADYVLPEKSVSRMHVKFIFEDEENTVFMQDLNSTNGTFHNGIRLENNELVPIYAGDEIQIGKRIFEYI